MINISIYLPSRICYKNIHCSKILSIEDNITTHCDVRQWISSDSNKDQKWFCINHEPKNSKDKSTILLNEILDMNISHTPLSYTKQPEIQDDNSKNMSNHMTIIDHTKQPSIPYTSNPDIVLASIEQNITSPLKVSSTLLLSSPCVDVNSIKEMSESGGIEIANDIIALNIGELMIMITFLRNCNR
jgi:hypothetical protein